MASLSLLVPSLERRSLGPSDGRMALSGLRPRDQPDPGQALPGPGWGLGRSRCRAFPRTWRRLGVTVTSATPHWHPQCTNFRPRPGESQADPARPDSEEDSGVAGGLSTCQGRGRALARRRSSNRQFRQLNCNDRKATCHKCVCQCIHHTRQGTGHRDICYYYTSASLRLRVACLAYDS
jgi:hypothetical protein